jgi:hypothetical protein
MIKELHNEDLGKWIIYTPNNERGKIKTFDNKNKVAWIVYRCNNNWDLDHWKDYTAEGTNYKDIKELKEKI